MRPGIHIATIWSDDDIVELRIRVSDGSSTFINQTYVGHVALEDAIRALQTFKDHVHRGRLDPRFGEFGPEYANGAFHARLHFAVPGRLFVSCEQESAYAAFGRKKVASRAEMYLKSEPALLDRFIGELRALAAGTSETAELEAIRAVCATGGASQ